MAIGCSHGNRANQDALAAVLIFRERFQPDEVIHLGDAYDLASLRSGSLRDPQDSDQADDYLDDIQEGAKFLDDLRPTVFTIGNHDDIDLLTPERGVWQRARLGRGRRDLHDAGPRHLDDSPVDGVRDDGRGNSARGDVLNLEPASGCNHVNQPPQ